jgi:hypothetical protein
MMTCEQLVVLRNLCKKTSHLDTLSHKPHSIFDIDTSHLNVVNSNVVGFDLDVERTIIEV